MWFRLYTKSNVVSPSRFLELTLTIALHWKVTVEVGRENCNTKAETASGSLIMPPMHIIGLLPDYSKFEKLIAIVR